MLPGILLPAPLYAYLVKKMRSRPTTSVNLASWSHGVMVNKPDKRSLNIQVVTIMRMKGQEVFE